MDLSEAVKECKRLLDKFPILEENEIRTLQFATSIITTECSNALWEMRKGEVK